MLSFPISLFVPQWVRLELFGFTIIMWDLVHKQVTFIQFKIVKLLLKARVRFCFERKTVSAITLVQAIRGIQDLHKLGHVSSVFRYFYTLQSRDKLLYSRIERVVLRNGSRRQV